MNNLATVIPDAWIIYPGNHGQGSRLRPAEAFRIRPAIWLDLAKRELYARYRLTDPNYYGRWKYIHNLNDWPANPDFFQVINNAMKIGNGGVAPPIPKTYSLSGRR